MNVRKPNFIVGGALKAGTTAIYHYLRQHPQVFMAADKELRFFSYDEKDPWCITHPKGFPVKTFDKYLEAFSGAKDEIAIGEASPMYLHSEFAARKIRECLPDAKLIFSLRNPIDSAYSSFQMDFRVERETRSVEDGLGIDQPRVQRYRYYFHLKKWFELFPPENIKIIIFDDIVEDPASSISGIYRFLHVDESFVPEEQNVERNRGGMPRNRVAGRFYLVMQELGKLSAVQRLKGISPESIRKTYKSMRDASLAEAPPLAKRVRSELTAYYAQDLRHLHSLVDVDISRWNIV
jgi:hypothetical protein